MDWRKNEYTANEQMSGAQAVVSIFALFIFLILGLVIVLTPFALLAFLIWAFFVGG